MKKLLLFSLFFLLLINISNAQEPCGTKAPGDEWEQWFQTKIAERKANLASERIQQTNYVIPVIVHIIHNGDDVGSNENLLASRIQSQIDNLNLDFAGTNSDINNLPSYFQGVKAGNTGIQFCLAKQKPNGTSISENGIDRININDYGFINPINFTSIDQLKSEFRDKIKPRTIWDPNRYLNIWIADFYDSDVKLFGYATFPIGTGINDLPQNGSSIESDTTSGVVINTYSFGNINIASTPTIVSRKRVATHEIGHWLGLYHISGKYEGDNSCSFFNDYCFDTPPSKGMDGFDGQNIGCPPAKWNSNTCFLLNLSSNHKCN